MAKLQEFQADFKEVEPFLKCSKFSSDNQLLVTGGEDCIVRVYDLNTQDYKSSTKKFELQGHSEPITSLDISPDKKYIVSSSSDKSCLIYDLTKNG